MTREEFWQIAYLAQLNNSQQVSEKDRSTEATLAACIAVADLDEYQASQEIFE